MQGLDAQRMQWLAHIIKEVLARWGYLALAGGLVGECAGLPLPGETTLMYASFVAHSSELNIFLVILVGSAAAILGDNIGYWAGKRLGRGLLRWLERKFHMEDDIAAAADLIWHHGAATIFWARYIFGLRTVAGPVAGALGMEWRKFLLFNALGAVSWVSCIALTGYFLAATIRSLAGFIEKASWGITAAVFIAGYFMWREKKKEVRESQRAMNGRLE
jgi:membrane protein DedA with SNARE-associated domain